MGGNGCHGPGNQRADANQPGNHAADMGQLCEAQRQPPFKEDDGYRNGNNREKQFAEQFIRVDQARDGAGNKSKQQEQEDGRQANSPGQPLRPYPEDDNAR